MLTANTADTAPPADTATTEHQPSRADTELRPVRLLVPTERRGDYYLTRENTLLASDLGITRDTTDRQLKNIVRKYGPATNYKQVTALRDGLRHPRDIDEARAWGLHIPVTDHENREELDDDPTKHLGWWWVYDPTRLETREQRRTRYLADHRHGDYRCLARVLCRTYVTTRDFAVRTEFARAVLNGKPGAMERAFQKFMKENPRYDGTDAELKNLLISKAHTDIARGTNPPVGWAGQSPLYHIGDALDFGRVTKRLDEWYEFLRVKQTGRPRGSKTRNWKPDKLPH